VSGLEATDGNGASVGARTCRENLPHNVH